MKAVSLGAEFNLLRPALPPPPASVRPDRPRESRRWHLHARTTTCWQMQRLN